MMEKLEKIRKILGKDYHLCVGYDPICENVEWKLFKKYTDLNVYYSNDNKAIMNSDDNTIDELYEYAKTHHKINENFAFRKIWIYLSIMTNIIFIINIVFIHSGILSGIILGVYVSLFLNNIIGSYIFNKNLKVEMLEHRENFKKIIGGD